MIMEDWTQKYRPETLDQILGNDKAVAELRAWANSWEQGNPSKKGVVLVGEAGVGKTSGAHALARDFNWGIIELTASEPRNAETIRKIVMTGAIHETFTDDGEFLFGKLQLTKVRVAETMLILRHAAAKTAARTDQVSLGQLAERVLHSLLVQLHHGVTIALLIAGIDQCIERQWILLRRRDFLLDQTADNSFLMARQSRIHDHLVVSIVPDPVSAPQE